MDSQTEQDKNVVALANAKIFLKKDYLQFLDQARPVGIAQTDDCAKSIRLIHIQTLLYDQQESISEKLKALFGAVENYGESIMMLINGKTDRAEVYLGVACEQAPQPVFQTFLRSVDSLLPGCQYKVLHNEAIRSLMEEVLPAEETIHIASLAAFPAEKADDSEKLQKLDTLIEGMKHAPFSLLLLAQSIRQDELAAMQQQLERLYTEFSSLEKITLSSSESISHSTGESISQAISESIGVNASISRGHSHSSGTNTAAQPGNAAEKAQHEGMLQLAGTAATLLVSGGNPIQTLFYAGSVSRTLGGIENALNPDSSLLSEPQVSTHEESGENEGQQAGMNRQKTTNEQTGTNINDSKTSGNTKQITETNKTISDILALLDMQLKQIASFQKEGAFNTAAYLIAGDNETAVSAANLYRSICVSGTLPSLRSPICQWMQTTDTAIIRNYLSQGRHPVFHFPKDSEFPEVCIAQMIGLRDMPRYFSLPESTVPGMIVSKSACFSRDIVSKNFAAEKQSQRTVHIGYIYHMGKEDRQCSVDINIDDLTKHLFVSGATGVGKSNFCYQLLDELDKQGIKMMIIEPAKGEYRHALGGRKGFSVYGVNPSTEPLLRINPFACPDGIPTLQHIERLLDIFNTAWPMYSAMPAILKEAVELIYTEKGFDMLSSSHPAGTVFPSFDDLLAALPRVIKESSYSAEVKGNYEGALVTRVKSLTNGLYGLIFTSDELGDDKLFNQNVIVDISRVGSAETKALIMGILTTRLIEYRQAEGKINSPLRHVTVLEEAHNLLRKHVPSSDGNNVRTASVEMLASAIAEMRSSGQGFIIADQSPSVMDSSVIRNTQTKVFFMLPDRDDRDIAGNSLSLSEDQKQEIARLRPGVAAVYQNGWTDSVLCKIEYFDKSRERPFQFANKEIEIDHCGLISQAIASLLLRRIHEENSSFNPELAENYLSYDDDLLNQKEKFAKAVLKKRVSDEEHVMNPNEEYTSLFSVFPMDAILIGAGKEETIAAWTEAVKKDISRQVQLTDTEIEEVISLGLLDLSRKRNVEGFKRLYLKYKEYIILSKNNAGLSCNSVESTQSKA